MEKQVRRAVFDLGEAAFVKIKGFRCVGREGRNFYFDVPEDKMELFDALNLEYINSPLHDFDSCIMSMKKVMERMAEPTGLLRKSVSDLGTAAYIKMHGFKCAGRKTRNFFFEIAEEDKEKFDMLTIEYLGSYFHDFDSAIMSLKKLGEYLAVKS